MKTNYIRFYNEKFIVDGLRFVKDGKNFVLIIGAAYTFKLCVASNLCMFIKETYFSDGMCKETQ